MSSKEYFHRKRDKLICLNPKLHTFNNLNPLVYYLTVLFHLIDWFKNDIPEYYLQAEFCLLSGHVLPVFYPVRGI